MIMENYRKELNNLHAPEELILRTLARVQEEEQKVREESQAAIDQSVNIDKNVVTNGYTGNQTSKNTNTYTGNQTSIKSNIYTGYKSVDEIDSNEGYQSAEKKDKVSFFGKYRKQITVFSTFVAAAAVLFLIVKSGIFGGGNYSATDSPSSGNYAESTTMAEMSDEAGAAYDEEASDDSMKESYSSNSAAAETTEAGDDFAAEADYDEDVAAEAEEESDNSYNNESRDTKKSGESLSAGDNDIDLSTVSIGEYSGYIGIDLEILLGKVSIRNSSLFAKVDNNTNELKKDFGVFDIDVPSGTATLRVSKTDEVASLSMKELDVKVIGKHDVYIDEESTAGKCLAAFDIDEVHFLLETEGVTTEDFEKILEDILEE